MEPEDLVKTNCKEVHNSILEQENFPNWKEIADDLRQLNWLELDPSNACNVCESIIDIGDLCALESKDGNKRFNVLKLNRVKNVLNNNIFAFTSDNQKVKELCGALKKKINSISFFQIVKNDIFTGDASKASLSFRKYDTIFTDFKNTVSPIFTPIDAAFRRETGKTIQSFMESEFYNQAIVINKAKIQGDAKQLLEKYEPTTFGHSTNYYWQTGRQPDYYGEVSQEGKKQGYGKVTFPNGDTYEGNWENDQMDGLGIYTWKIGGRYEGAFEAGKIQGAGKRSYASGNVYEGEFLDGKKQGKGVMVFSNGDIYEGDWNKDDMEGQGTYKWVSGDTYVGSFQRDKRHGSGCLTLFNQEVYNAEWFEDKMVDRAKN